MHSSLASPDGPLPTSQIFQRFSLKMHDAEKQQQSIEELCSHPSQEAPALLQPKFITGRCCQPLAESRPLHLSFGTFSLPLNCLQRRKKNSSEGERTGCFRATGRSALDLAHGQEWLEEGMGVSESGASPLEVLISKCGVRPGDRAISFKSFFGTSANHLGL